MEEIEVRRLSLQPGGIRSLLDDVIARKRF
jgi:hypothetical protein